MNTTSSNGCQGAVIKQQEALCKKDLQRVCDSTLCFGRMDKPIVSTIRLQRMRAIVGLWETARQLHDSTP